MTPCSTISASAPLPKATTGVPQAIASIATSELVSGALADIVEHGVTGFLVRDLTEMAAAIQAADRLCPSTIRRIARQRFSAEAMLAGYVAAYERLAHRGSSHAA